MEGQIQRLRDLLFDLLFLEVPTNTKRLAPRNFASFREVVAFAMGCGKTDQGHLACNVASLQPGAAHHGGGVSRLTVGGFVRKMLFGWEGMLGEWPKSPVIDQQRYVGC